MENGRSKHDINEQKKYDINEQALRIIKIMEDENMNSTQFAEAIGIRRAAMSHLTTGRNKPSADIITKVIKRFNTINPIWLLTGEGNMRINPVNGNNVEINSPNVNYGNVNNENDEKSSKAFNYKSDIEPDLFNNHNISVNKTVSPKNYTSEENIRTEILFTGEKIEGREVKTPKNIGEIVEKEVVIYKERPVKTIDKLLIFYSDNTFESFIPEKHL